MFSCNSNGNKNENLNEKVQSKYQMFIRNSCAFDKSFNNKKVYSFSSDQEAEEAMKDIMKLTGLPSNFTIKSANVSNACAVVYNKKRYILYNPEFMEKINDDSKTHFAEIAILAHEIGHHLSGHTLKDEGSNYDDELESDNFSGYMLFKLGATIEESKSAFNQLPVQGSLTHPPKAARIAAVTNGWYSAKRNGETPSIRNDIKLKTEKNTTLKNIEPINSPQKIEIEIKNALNTVGSCNCSEVGLTGYFEDLVMRLTYNNNESDIIDFQNRTDYITLYSRTVTLKNGEEYNRVYYMVQDGSNRIGCKGCRSQYDFRLLDEIKSRF
jgi:hypothetical protein